MRLVSFDACVRACVRACVLIVSVCCLAAAFSLRVNEAGDVITVMLDFTAGTISFAKNGVCPGYGCNIPSVVSMCFTIWLVVFFTNCCFVVHVSVGQRGV